MWTRGNNAIWNNAIRWLYAQNTWRIVESIEAKSRRRGCDAAIVRPSVPLLLSVWLNVSLSPFSAYFSVVLSCISFLILFLSFTIFNLLRRSSVSLDLLMFLSRFVYFVFFLCKILTPRITIFSFQWNPWNPSSCSHGQIQLTSRTRILSSHVLRVKPFLFESFIFIFNVIKLGESYNTMKC